MRPGWAPLDGCHLIDLSEGRFRSGTDQEADLASAAMSVRPACLVAVALAAVAAGCGGGSGSGGAHGTTPAPGSASSEALKQVAPRQAGPLQAAHVGHLPAP